MEWVKRLARQLGDWAFRAPPLPARIAARAESPAIGEATARSIQGAFDEMRREFLERHAPRTAETLNALVASILDATPAAAIQHRQVRDIADNLLRGCERFDLCGDALLDALDAVHVLALTEAAEFRYGTPAGRRSARVESLCELAYGYAPELSSRRRAVRERQILDLVREGLQGVPPATTARWNATKHAKAA